MNRWQKDIDVADLKSLSPNGHLSLSVMSTLGNVGGMKDGRIKAKVVMGGGSLYFQLLFVVSWQFP